MSMKTYWRSSLPPENAYVLVRRRDRPEAWVVAKRVGETFTNRRGFPLSFVPDQWKPRGDSDISQKRSASTVDLDQLSPNELEAFYDDLQKRIAVKKLAKDLFGDEDVVTFTG